MAEKYGIAEPVRIVNKLIANPEKIAPATKYGGKIVVCQPGTTDVAKSKDTIVCTDNTSGVLKPANTSDKAS